MWMRLQRQLPLGAVALWACAGAVHAADRPLDLAFNVGAATDYVFRGVSQTRGRGEAFGGADVTLGRIGYAGAWLSNVDFGDSTKLEYDLYAGVRPVVGPVTLDLGAIRYGYGNVPHGADWNYWEVKAAGSMGLGPATVGAALFYSPNATGPGKVQSYYYELNGSLPIRSSRFVLSGAVGRESLQGPGDYTTWDAGVGYALTDKLGLDLRYWDTDAPKAFGKNYKARVVASIKATF